MADPKNEVKQFKQYLIETNAYQTMVEIFALLHKANPKPVNPLQFVTERLNEPSIDAEEFRNLKRSFDLIKDDINQVKLNLAKVAKVLSKLVPDCDSLIDSNVLINNSSESMDNNVGDRSNISILNDSSLIYDDAINKTVINSTDIDATLQAESSTPDTSANQTTEPLAEGFTMEIVEVDVHQQSQSSLMLSQDEKNDEKMMCENGSNGQHKEENGDCKNESGFLDSSTGADLMSSTPNEPVLEESVDETKTDIKIEDLPIVLKSEGSEEQLQSSQPFHGFSDRDVQSSQKRLSDAKFEGSEVAVPKNELSISDSVTCDIEQPLDCAAKADLAEDESNCDEQAIVPAFSMMAKDDHNQSIEYSTFKDESADDQSISENTTLKVVLVDGESNGDKQAIASEIVDNVVEHIVGDQNRNVTTCINDCDKEQAEKIAECIYMPKDDPETELFLSYCQ